MRKVPKSRGLTFQTPKLGGNGRLEADLPLWMAVSAVSEELLKEPVTRASEPQEGTSSAVGKL
jgi:hypothetical protein